MYAKKKQAEKTGKFSYICPGFYKVHFFNIFQIEYLIQCYDLYSNFFLNNRYNKYVAR